MHSRHELQLIRTQLSHIYEALDGFNPQIPKPPILDLSISRVDEPGQQGIGIPGLKKLKDEINIDLNILDKFLNDADGINFPPINAPYVISVWHEVLCAQQPIVAVFETFLLNPDVDNWKKRGYGAKRHPPGAKVDVVADNGRRWIRVNTIKNSRLLAEFREIDSYLTDSEEEPNEEWDNEQRPTLCQTEFDNSILRMGRLLSTAAKANSIGKTSGIPAITLRLTRLNPDLLDDVGRPPDPRIRQTIDMLIDMGIQVVLGERLQDELPTPNRRPPNPSSSNLRPTSNINLDLSALIALISDLTHSPLPKSIQEANKRFVPPPEYREWKQQRNAVLIGKGKKSNKANNTRNKNKPEPPDIDMPSAMENDINDLPKEFIKHARQLTTQLLQETTKALLQEIRDKTSSESDGSTIKFWTTPEARDRCLRIVWKIGGVQEKRRVRALFQLPSDSPESTTTTHLSLEEAENLYWQESRFPHKFIPLLPINILPNSCPPPPPSSPCDVDPKDHEHSSRFSFELANVCSHILSQQTAPPVVDNVLDITSSPSSNAKKSSYNDTVTAEGIQRARFTKSNPRLTAHTVQTMQWGATLGWTILTSNRTSVKAILKELRAAAAWALGNGTSSTNDKDEDKGKEEETAHAAIWIVDPRSLAEGMSSLPVKSLY